MILCAVCVVNPISVATRRLWVVMLSCTAQADMKAEPRMAEDGRLWTPGAVDFFRTVNEQVWSAATMHAIANRTSFSQSSAVFWQTPAPSQA